jgi:hypothetical protein
MKKFNAAFDQLFEELRQPKEVRIDNLSDQLSQIHNISGEIDESGLSQTKLEGYQYWFQKLQTDKVIWLPRQILYQLVAGLKTRFDFIHKAVH